MGFYYGIDIGGTKMELAVFNEQLGKLHSERIPTPQTSYEDWLSAIEALVGRADQKFNTKGVLGLGIPGFLNHETGVAKMANIRVADGKPIVEDLSVRLGREVRIENDANCFALSEAWDRESRSFSTVLGLILGTGFGAGLVLNGKVHSGKSGMAGEVGHIPLNYPALQLLGKDKVPIYPCGCGNNACLDSYLSGRGFEMLYRDLVGEALTAKAIITRFYERDLQTVNFVEMFIELLATSISNLITILDPEMIVLGGGLSNFDHIYIALPKALPKYLIKGTPLPVIKKAIYGDSSGVRGAAALCLT